MFYDKLPICAYFPLRSKEKQMKRTKKILTVITALSLLLTSLTVSAASNVAEVIAEDGTTTGYTSFYKAFAAVKTGELVNSTIRLVSDCTENIYCEDTEARGYQYTIDLNGHTLRYTGKNYLLQNKAELTITDLSENGGGSIVCASSATGVIYNNIGRTVTVENVTITSEASYALYASGFQADTYDIKNSVITSKASGGYAIKINGGSSSGFTAPLNISGDNTQINGKISTKGGTINISGGRIKSAIENQSGTQTVSVTGGWFTSANYDIATENIADGYIWTDDTETYSGFLGFVGPYRGYTLELGDLTLVPGTENSFRVGSVEVEQAQSMRAKLLSVAVDKGSLTVPWSEVLLGSIDRIYGINTAGEFVSTTAAPSGDISYKAVTIAFDSEPTDAQIISFIKAVVFSVDGNYVSQKVYAGLSKTTPEGYLYFAGSSYKYVSAGTDWNRANLAAIESGGHLITVSSELKQIIAEAIADGTESWTGGVSQYGAWYWLGGSDDGLRITSNENTTQAYGDAYTYWVSSPSFGAAEPLRIFLTDSGRWNCANAALSKNYIIEIDDVYASAARAEFAAVSSESSVLTAIAPSYEQDIQMTYYFSFTEEAKASTLSKVTISVGTEKTVEKYVSEIISENEVTEYGDYPVTVSFSPKTMADPVTITVFDGDNTRVYGNGNGYNIVYYASKIMELGSSGSGDKYNDSFSPQIVNAVKALLHYGAAAQEQFGYNTENPADAGISAPGAIGTIDTDKTFIKTEGGNMFGKAALVSDSMTGMRIYLKKAASLATVNGTEYDVINDNGQYYVQFPICAKDIFRIYSVSVDGYTLLLNANYVLASIVGDSTQAAAARTTAYRLYEFGLAAAECYSSYEISSNCLSAVLSSGYAFLAKTLNIQYDQSRLIGKNYISGNASYSTRRQMAVYPEDATDENSLYMDCSSFVFNIYRTVFGTEKAKLAFGYSESDYHYAVQTATMLSKGNSVYSCGQTSYSSTDLDDAHPEVYSEILDVVQPGDLIVKYRYSGGGYSAHGHVGMWTGDGVLHCTGSSYNFDSNTDTVEPNGAIVYIPASEFATKFTLDQFNYVTVLRPLANLSAADIEERGDARKEAGALGVSVTAANGDGLLYNGLSVKAGDTMTYTITVSNPELFNFLSADRVLNISAVLPAGVTFVSANENGAYNTKYNTIYWNGADIQKGGAKSFEITVSVNASGYSTDALGRNIIAGLTAEVSMAEGIKYNRKIMASSLSYIVEGTFDGESIIQNAQAYRDGNMSTSLSGIAFINNLFGSYGFGSKYTSDSAVLSDLVTLNNSLSFPVYRVLSANKGKPVMKYLSSNFIGGRSFYTYSYSPFTVDERTRNIEETNLKAGDVIMQYNEGTYTYYVYLGPHQKMLQVGSDGCSSAYTSVVLDRLIGASQVFAVFRFLGR